VADQLCTVAQVKARDEIPDAADDAVLSELIDQVTDFIQGYTRRRLLPDNAKTYFLDTAAGSVIEAPRGIRAVTSIDIASSDQPDTGGTFSTSIAAADILLRPSELYRQPGWPPTQILLKGTSVGRLTDGLNRAKVVGDFDFAATPPAIQAVAIDAVVAAFAARTDGASEVIGADDLPSTPWAKYFGEGSPQLNTLRRFRAGSTIGMA
jgi:gp6-like head-tail connector protein